MDRLTLIVLCAVQLSISCSYCCAQDSVNVRRVGDLEFWSTPEEIEVASNIAYVLTEKTGVRIVDVSTPSSPVEIARTPDMCARSFARAGDYLYIGPCSPSMFQIVNISDPAAPFPMGTQPLPWEALDVDIEGNYAFVSAERYGVRVIDISDPWLPVEVGSYHLDQMYNFAAGVSGNLVCMVESPRGLAILDVSDPASPQRRGQFWSNGAPRDVVVFDTLAYLADMDSGLYVINIADPSLPTLVTRLPDVRAWKLKRTGIDLAAIGYSLYWLDVANPPWPVVLQTYTDGYSTDAVITDEHMYVLDHEDALYVLDVLNPAIPDTIAHFDPTGTPRRFAIQNNFAYLADVNEGLLVASIQNPFAPLKVGEANTGYLNHQVAVDGNFAYLAHDMGGLVIVDVNDPTQPDVVGSFHEYDFETHGVAAGGGYAYTANYGNLFSVFDVSDPTSPERIYESDGFYGGFHRAFLSGHILYLGGSFTFRSFDVSDPSAPVQSSYFNSPWPSGAINDFVVSGDLVYLATEDSGLIVLNTSQPGPAEVVAWNDNGTHVHRVEASGDFLFKATPRKLEVFNVANPMQPVLVGMFDSDRDHQDLVYWNGYLYSSGDHDLTVFDVSAALRVRPERSPAIIRNLKLGPAYPNPFNSSTMISYELPESCNIHLDLLNVLGQRVAGLYDGWKHSGAHHLLWNANAQPSGTYFVRLRARQHEAQLKLILMK